MSNFTLNFGMAVEKKEQPALIPYHNQFNQKFKLLSYNTNHFYKLITLILIFSCETLSLSLHSLNLKCETPTIQCNVVLWSNVVQPTIQHFNNHSRRSTDTCIPLPTWIYPYIVIKKKLRPLISITQMITWKTCYWKWRITITARPYDKWTEKQYSILISLLDFV